MVLGEAWLRKLDPCVLIDFPNEFGAAEVLIIPLETGVVIPADLSHAPCSAFLIIRRSNGGF